MALDDDPKFVQWATRATRGLTESGVMLGVWGSSGAPRYEFQLQIGHCLTTGKPLVLIVPEGVELPAKLEAAATVVERFIPILGEPALREATERALARVGIYRRQ